MICTFMLDLKLKASKTNLWTLPDIKYTPFGQNLQENTLMTRSNWDITFKKLRSRLELKSMLNLTLGTRSEEKKPSNQVKF